MKKQRFYITRMRTFVINTRYSGAIRFNGNTKKIDDKSRKIAFVNDIHRFYSLGILTEHGQTFIEERMMKVTSLFKLFHERC